MMNCVFSKPATPGKTFSKIMSPPLMVSFMDGLDKSNSMGQLHKSEGDVGKGSAGRITTGGGVGAGPVEHGMQILCPHHLHGP